MKRYSEWVGRPVVLYLSSGRRKVPLRCMLIGESRDRLRVRVEGEWDVDVYKEMVRAVEADGTAQFGAGDRAGMPGRQCELA